MYYGKIFFNKAILIKDIKKILYLFYKQVIQFIH